MGLFGEPKRPWLSLLKDIPSIGMKEIRNNFAEALDHVTYKEKRILITGRQTPRAGLIPARDLAVLEALKKEPQIYKSLCEKYPQLLEE